MDYVPMYKSDMLYHASLIDEIHLKIKFNRMFGQTTNLVLYGEMKKHFEQLDEIFHKVTKQPRQYTAWCYKHTSMLEGEFNVKKKYEEFDQLSYRLGSEDMAQLEAYAKQKDKTLEKMMEQLANDGYKMSQRYLLDNAVWVFTVTTTDEVVHTKRKFMSSYAGTLYDACLMAHYKIYVVFNGQDWFEKENSSFG